MASLNRVQLIGYLGGEPEMKFGQDTGKPYCRFSLATAEGRGENARTEWHHVVVFDKLAERCRDFLTKGKLIYLEGRLRTRKWRDLNDVERSATEILGFSMKMLDRREREEGVQAEAGRPESETSAAVSAPLENDPFSGPEAEALPYYDEAEGAPF